MSQRQDYRDALAAFFGDKALRHTGNDFATFRKRNGDTACARFYAEADQIVAILESLGLVFEDEEDLLSTEAPEPIKKGKGK